MGNIEGVSNRDEVNGSIGYQGHGHHKTLPNGKSSGSIVISPGTIQFRCNATTETFPIEGAEFTLGGASDRIVFISHVSRSGWSFYTSDRSILSNELLRNNTSVSEQLSKAKRKRWLNHSILALMLFLVVFVPLMVISSMDRITGVAVNHVPPEWEKKIGEAVYAQYKVGERLMPAEKTAEVLGPVVEPLLAALKSGQDQQHFEVELAIVDNSEINAFALPGGFVVINSGLILAADSADEMLGVVAHELSHVTERHSIRNIISAAGIYLTIDLILGDISGLLAMAVDAAPLLLHQQFSREFEREADTKGYELLVRANVDPRGLAVFFEKLVKERDQRMGEIDDDVTRELMLTTEGLLSTHPATQERIEYIESMTENDVGPYVELSGSFKSLQREVEAFVLKTKE